MLEAKEVIFSGELYDCGNSAVMKLLTDKSIDDYISLCESFTADGYEKIQFSKTDLFSGATFKKDGELISLSFDEAAGELRCVKDTYSAMLNTKYSKADKCPVRMWQFEVDHTLIDCGMCYIVQCSDYSFFIVDSAHTYSVNGDIRIFELLRKETPEGLPVIVSGWFLSHGHVDHIAKFQDILMYNKDIIIQGIYYNFVPTDHFSSGAWMNSDKNHTDNFNREVEKRNDIPKYKLHSGQYFYIDCLRFDVLCTHEDIYPASLENYNDSSCVLMMSAGEDKVCFPGDAGGEESRILERRFPDFLKCDIMQVAHHGHFGTTSEFYRKAQAKVALFATTQIKFDEEYPHYEANRVACDIAKHTFVAANGTVRFTFPLEGSEILCYPDETDESFEGVYNLWGYDYTEDFKAAHKKRFNESKEFKKINY